MRALSFSRLCITLSLCIHTSWTSTLHWEKLDAMLPLQCGEQEQQADACEAASGPPDERRAGMVTHAVTTLSKLYFAAHSSLLDTERLCWLYFVAMCTRTEQQELFGFTPFPGDVNVWREWVVLPFVLHLQATLVRFLMHPERGLVYGAVLCYLLATDCLVSNVPDSFSLVLGLLLYWIVAGLARQGHGVADLLFAKLFVTASLGRLHDSGTAIH